MFERSLNEMSTLPELVFLSKTIYVRQDPDCQLEYQSIKDAHYVCKVSECMAGYTPANAWISEVKCNRL